MNEDIDINQFDEYDMLLVGIYKENILPDVLYRNKEDNDE